MTQATAMVLMFILYGVLPAAGIYLGYRGVKKLTQPKMLEYKAMPQLGYIPEKSLPPEVKQKLDSINDKGEKLKMLYGDTNNDGVIDDSDAVTETYIMIKNVMDKHIPEAVADYRRLHDLDSSSNKTVVISAEKSSTESSRADTTKIKNSDMTGRQALMEVLNTVETQFDGLLDAAYHQDGQKLLATNRYLQQRFEK
ncbi:MAG TPA: hypothetical protein DCQ89_05475 [Psychrobacter sp.]|uniref:Uncharacterized protein n=1 Tax=Psychrobacter pasteurii TaxID=1945520 RepID=A0A1R4EDQ4_9GAMM|nr:hypothetical protein [Psychrobacter pasteurii]SJM36578.1 hypothetical protein A1019T_00539 [Psychrobacter pasteurii]HAO59785.1 hypothetical protein [Psychrobacter sp.]